jgi:hypothetical protein
MTWPHAKKIISFHKVIWKNLSSLTIYLANSFLQANLATIYVPRNAKWQQTTHDKSNDAS